MKSILNSTYGVNASVLVGSPQGYTTDRIYLLKHHYTMRQWDVYRTVGGVKR